MQSRFSNQNYVKGERANTQRLFWVLCASFLSVFFVIYFLIRMVVPTQAATPPSIVTYQGKLLESGASVTTSKSMAFLMYDALTGGNLLYTASGTLVATTTISVTPTSGIFSVNIGDTGTNSLDPTIFRDNATLYLEVIVDGTTLSPRKRITTAPFATNAQYLMGIGSATASTTQYIPQSDTDGNFSFTGSPTSTAVSGGIIYINPAAATADFTLFGVAVNGNQRFRIDEDGDVWNDGAFVVSTTLTVGTTSTVGGNAYVGNASEVITTSTFVMNGDDMYVHDLLGVGDSVYIEDSLYIGTSTLRLNGSNAGGVIAMTNGSLTIDSDTGLLLNSTNNQPVMTGSGNFGVNTTSPQYQFTVDGDGFLTGTVTATEFVASTAITLNGDRRTAWPTGAGGAWTTTTNLIYPNNTTDVTVIGKTATASASNIFEVEGNTYINGNLGIASATPQYGLAVSGTSYVRGEATFNSTTTINSTLSLPGRAINPAHLSSIANGTDGAPLNGPGQMMASGPYLYVSAFDDDDLTILDISDPANISYVGSIADAAGVPLNGPGSVFVQGNYAYVAANQSNALTIIDVSNPSNPTFVSTLADGGAGEPYLTGLSQVFVAGNYAYITSVNDNALQVVDISDPFNPRAAGSLLDGGGSGPFFDQPYSLFVSGGYAYVVTYAFGGTSYVNVIDVSDPTNPAYVSSIVDGGAGTPYLTNATAIVYQNHYLYVSANGDDALEIIDVSDPLNPTHAGAVVHNGTSVLLNGPRTTYVAGDYAYTTAETSNTVTITDVSSSTNPTVVATVQDGGVGVAPHLSGALGIATRGNYLFVGSASDDDVEVIDITGANISNADIGNASISILHVESPAFFEDALLVRGSASIGTGKGGGLLLGGDLSLFSATTSISNTNTIQFSHTGLFNSLASSSESTFFEFDTQNTASSADLLSVRNNGTQRFVIRDTGFVGINSSTPSQFLSVEGNAYINGTVTADDIVVSNSITLGGVSRTSWPGPGGAAWTTSTNLMYPAVTPSTTQVVIGTFVTSTAGSILEVTGTTTLFGNLFVGNATEQMTTTSFVMDGDDMYVADLLGVRDSLYVENSLYVGTSTLALNGDNNGGLITMGSGELTIDSDTLLNLNTLNNQPVVFGSGNVGINTTTASYNLTVEGTAYISGTTTFSNGLNTFSGRATAGQPLGLYTFPDLPGDFVVDGDYAYVASGLDRSVFYIVDVSDKQNPTFVGSTGLGGRVTDVDLAGEYVYISRGNSGFSVIDVSDVANPLTIFDPGSDEMGFTGHGTAISVSGNYAYVTTGDDEILTIDISDPKFPFVTASTTSAYRVLNDIKVSGNYIYVASQDDDAFIIYDVSDPANIVELSAVNSTTVSLEQPQDIVIRGKYAYVTSYNTAVGGGGGLTIFDITDPAGPSEVGYRQNGSSLGLMRGLELSGDYAYLADVYNNNVVVIDVSSSTNPTFITEFQGNSGSQLSINGITRLKVDGGYLYGTYLTSSTLEIFDIQAAQVANAEIGTVKTTNFRATNNSYFENNVSIRGGLSIGSNGLLVSGDFGMSVPTTTINGTNTLRFSHTALFKTSGNSTSEDIAFIFDTAETWASSTSRYLLSLRTGGTPAFSVATNGDVHTSGTLFASSATVGTPGAPGDLAERVDIATDDTVLPGDVVIVDPSAPDTYRRSTQAYSEKVAGVISTNPTIVIGDGRTQNTAVMAMIGRVPVNVSLDNGPIARGDLLVTASTTGRAMRYDPTTDPGSKVVGIIGIAVDSYDGTTPSGTAPSAIPQVMTLIRTGWVYNEQQSIAQIQQELATLAAAQGQSTSGNGQTLSVGQSGSQLTYTNAGNLDMGWNEIVNVMAVRGEQWEIDRYGRFVTKVQVTEGEAPLALYAVQAQGSQLILSGSGVMQSGLARIDFSTTTQYIIDQSKPVRVNVVLTSDANPIYVRQKDYTGFRVREVSNGSSSGATFDWVAIVERRLDVTPQQVQQVVQQNQTSGSSPSTTSTATTASSTVQTPTSTPQNTSPQTTSSTPQTAATSTPATGGSGSETATSTPQQPAPTPPATPTSTTSGTSEPETPTSTPSQAASSTSP